jgi:hypothetical protein
MTEIIEFEDFPGLKGRVFEVPDYRLTELEVEIFEDITGVTAAHGNLVSSDNPVGMIEGFHTLSLLDYLTTSLFRPNPRNGYQLNYGINRLRFPSPLTIEQHFRFRLEVLDVADRNGGHLMTYGVEIHAHGAHKPGLVADWLNVVLPRETEELRTVEHRSRATRFSPKL